MSEVNILADLTMGELTELYPSAPLTLFARFGVGSRDKLGFRAEQSLRQVLARYFVFDLEKVVATVKEADQAQASLQIQPSEAAARLHEVQFVDVRGPDEFAMGALPGAIFLDSQGVERLREHPSRPVVFYCRSGPFGGAAAQHFRTQGFAASALRGGLLAWAEEVDSAFPIYGVDVPERSGRLRILPLRRRARVPLEGVEPLPPGRRLLAHWPEGAARLWRQRAHLVIEREHPVDWVSFSVRLWAWIAEAGLDRLLWVEEEFSHDQLVDKLHQSLAGPVQEQLSSHKGRVQLVELRGDVARLSLSGGCQGCSGAALTVAEEIAATLMAEIPQLWAVEDATEHNLEGLSPHH